MKPSAVILYLCLLSAEAPALTYTVTNTNNSGAGSLRQAIEDANAHAGADTVNFSALFNAAQTIDLGVSSQLVITDAVTIDAPSGATNKVTIVAANASRVFFVSEAGTVTLRYLTMTNGEDVSGFSPGGGGILVEDSHLFAEHCELTDCSTLESGGGILASGDGAELTLTDCTITDNFAAERGGGVAGSYAGGVTLTRCTVSRNESADGGGVSGYAGSLSMMDCAVNNNTADGQGGGVFRQGQGTFSISDSTVNGNEAGTDGGGIYTVVAASILGCTVANNSAAGSYGGGVYAGAATVRDSTISGNSCATYGGGIYFYNTGSATMTNCTVSGNTCTNAVSSSGGGVSSGQLTMLNTTITANTAVRGAGINKSGSSGSRFGNTIIAGNNGPDLSGAFVSVGHNLIGDAGTGTGFVHGVAGDIVGDAANPVDPHLGPLAFNGGPTRTHSLLGGSPAFESGDSALVAAPDFVGPPFFDQTGSTRIRGNDVEMGALEVFNTFTVTNTNDSGAGSLRDAVTQANAAGIANISFQRAMFSSTVQTIVLTSGQITLTGFITLTGPDIGVVVSGNNASRIFNVTAGSLTMQHVRIINGNSTSDGGGLRVVGTGTSATLDDVGVSLSIAAGRGGGIFVEGAALNATNCTIVENTATGNGGGLSLAGSGTLDLTNSTVSNNKSNDQGGGLFVINSTATLINVTVAENTADFDANGTGDGGGIRRGGGTVNLGNTLVAKNTDASTATIHPDISGAMVSLGNNLIGKRDGGTGITNGTGGNQAGTIAVPLDPQLGPLQINHGTNRTHNLLTASPAIDAGDAALLNHAAWPSVPDRDERGQFRPVGTAPDIGASEFPNGDVVKLTVADGRASEYGLEIGKFRVRRSYKAASAQVVHLTLDAASTASAADYAFSGASWVSTGANTFDVTIPADDDGVLLTVTPLQDPAVEGTETVTVSLAAGAGYSLDSAATNTRTIDLLDSEFTVTSNANTGAGTLRSAVNAANDAGGGVITIPSPLSITLGGAPLTIESDVEIIGNISTVDAGGLSRVIEINSSGAGCVKLRGLIITGGFNGLLYTLGGGMAVWPGSCVEIRGCAITGNRTVDNGGGLSADEATLTIINSAIDNNIADRSGGGLSIGGGSTTLTNVTIAQNTSGSFGGGAVLGTTATVTNCTVTENTCTGTDSVYADGGGFYVSGTLTIGNTVIAGNTDTGFVDPVAGDDDYPDLSGSGVVTTAGQNFIGARNGLASNYFPTGSPNANGDYVGTNSNPLDAMLTPAVVYTQFYYEFPPESVLWNHGDNTGVTVTDQIGNPRTFGGTVDIGAIEMPWLLVTNAANVGAGSLRDAIVANNTAGGGGYLGFDPAFFNTPRTITLGAGGELSITAPLTIAGPPGANKRVTVSGALASRVFRVAPGAVSNVTLRDLDVTSGDTGANPVGNRGGAGILCGANARLILDGVTIRQCDAAADGGGVYILPGGTLTATDCTFSGNHADSQGGGLLNFSTVTLSACTFSGNTSGADGAGLANARNGTVTNCTFSGNLANNHGGGVFSAALAADVLTLRHCTIVQNHANEDNSGGGDGGGVRRGAGIVNLQNTLIAANDALGGANDDLSGTFVSLRGNFVGNVTGGTGITHGTNGDQAGTGGALLDPLLGPLQDNGRKTLTHAPLFGSPVVEAGDNSGAAGLTSDQRGVNRIRNSRPDTGSVEYQPQRTYVTLTDASAAEVMAPGAPQTAALQLVRDQSTGALPVALALSALTDAAGFGDFILTPVGPGVVTPTANGVTVIIPNGQTTVNLLLTPVDDGDAEGTEEAALYPLNGTFSTRDGNWPVNSVTIADNDFMVTQPGDSGPGTLRNAVATLTAAGRGGTITFDNVGNDSGPRPRTVLLNSPVAVTSSMQIIGPVDNAAGVTLSGQGATRVLELSSGTLTLRNLTIADGFAVDGGGLLQTGGTADLKNCTFTANTATIVGGAVHASLGTLNATNCTFSDNRTDGSGGGVHIGGATATFLNCTLTANHSDFDNIGGGGGGGMSRAAGSVSIRNCLIAANRTGAAGGSDLTGNITSLGRNLIGRNTGVTAAFPTGSPNANGDYCGSTALPIDPNIGPLLMNGGPTQTHAILNGSLAEDHGSNTGVSADDQRGLARISNGTTDIGAYEHQPVSYPFWAGYTFAHGSPQTGENGDFDSDGSPNWAEYYCGTDALNKSSLPRFAVSLIGPDVAYDSTLSRIADPARAVPEWSLNLNAWQGTGFTASPLVPLGTDRYGVRVLHAAPAAGRQLLRLSRVP